MSTTERSALLRRIRSVAIVGASANPARPSHEVATYLATNTDWTVWYVNPNETRILGQPVYASLADLPNVPDLVDVFRRQRELPTVVHDSIAVGAGAVWFQLGLEHHGAATAARDAGLEVVQNCCLKTEHLRFARDIAGSAAPPGATPSAVGQTGVDA